MLHLLMVSRDCFIFLKVFCQILEKFYFDFKINKKTEEFVIIRFALKCLISNIRYRSILFVNKITVFFSINVK